MKYIIITGGNFSNKGAQSMIFSTVNSLKEKYPDKEIIVISSNDFEGQFLDNGYTFDIFPRAFDMPLELLERTYRHLKNNKKRYSMISFLQCRKKFITILKNTDFIVDISGYALSSQFKTIPNYKFIKNIIIAKKHNIPIYILPQSFGPFDYKGFDTIFKFLIKKYIEYPKIIFTRESEGHTFMKQFGLTNLVPSFDLVLQTRKIKLENIFKKEIKLDSFPVKTNSVAIIPNQKLTVHGNNNLYEMYNKIIQFLLDNNKNVYLVHHSKEDLKICSKIQKNFENNENVILIKNELNSLELESLLLNFDFIIASRYHSIVHAYKQGIPVIALGWATKYKELLNIFGQSDYFFDIRSPLDLDLLLNRISKMIKDHTFESKNIIRQLNIIQENDIFEKIKKM
jgi:colanic acid/amylovoran biosynthesis protein